LLHFYEEVSHETVSSKYLSHNQTVKFTPYLSGHDSSMSQLPNAHAVKKTPTCFSLRNLGILNQTGDSLPRPEAFMLHTSQRKAHIHQGAGGMWNLHRQSQKKLEHSRLTPPPPSTPKKRKFSDFLCQKHTPLGNILHFSSFCVSHLRQGPIRAWDKGTSIIVNTCTIRKQFGIPKTLIIKCSK
jgi:hypothetical protein